MPIRIRHNGKLWDVRLVDDGTLDTVIAIRPAAIRHKYAGQEPEYWPEQEERFSQDFAAILRDSSGALSVLGLKSLAREAIEYYGEAA